MNTVRPHPTYVQKYGTTGYFAVCRTCGWSHPTNRKTLGKAEADAQAHGELNHIYPELAMGNRE